MNTELSKEHNTFMKFMQSYEPTLQSYVMRLQDEFRYEKHDVIDLIMQKLSKLGTTKDYSKSRKIQVAVALGNHRVGVVELSSSKYKYYVAVI